MATHKLLLLPGDGIGPEVMAEVKKLIGWMNSHKMGSFETEEGLVGRSVLRRPQDRDHRCDHGQGACLRCRDLGAVGGPKWGQRAL